MGVGRGQRDTQGQRLPIDDKHVARAAGRMADVANGETTAEERMGRIGYFDLGGIRVLEVGIKVMVLSTASPMPN